MRPSQVLCARTNGVNVLLSSNGVGTFRFLGATMVASVQPGVVTNAVTLSMPEHVTHGLVAVAVFVKEHGGGSWHGFILELSANLRISLEEQFLPSGNTIGTAHFNHIEVFCDGDRFVSSELAAKEAAGTMRFVPDPNALLELLLGTKTVADIRALAQEVEQEQAEVSQLRVLLDEARGAEARWHADFDAMLESRQQIARRYCALEDQLRAHQSAMDAVRAFSAHFARLDAIVSDSPVITREVRGELEGPER